MNDYATALWKLLIQEKYIECVFLCMDGMKCNNYRSSHSNQAQNLI